MSIKYKSKLIAILIVAFIFLIAVIWGFTESLKGLGNKTNEMPQGNNLNIN